MAGTAGESAAPPDTRPLPSPLDAVSDLRAAAKWTFAAAGVVGAALISGGPLVAVGQVHSAGRALLAGLGLALALVGVALAIWSTSKVLAPRLTTRQTLMSRDLASLRRDIDADPGQFLGTAATTVAGLFKRQDDHREITADLARQTAAAKEPARRAGLEVQLRRVEKNAARLDAHVRWLLALAHVWQIQADLRRSRWCTLAGGMLVVAGAVVFFIGTGSGPTYVPVLTPQVTQSPSAGSQSALPSADSDLRNVVALLRGGGE